MQDNAPCHKAKIVLSFLDNEGIAVVKRPPQSPDMNPIENVWKIIGEKAQNRNSQNIDDLCFFFLKEEWENITTTNAKESSLNIDFFFSLYIDLTGIYDAFFNFWSGQNVYFCFSVDY